MEDKITCSRCGARTPRAKRRCRICTSVLNGAIKEPARGLAALRNDGTVGSFEAPPPSEDPAVVVGAARPIDPEVASHLASARQWTSIPIEVGASWEPTEAVLGDGEDVLVSSIVIDAPSRNGPTPPPLTYEAERFDPDALFREAG